MNAKAGTPHKSQSMHTHDDLVRSLIRKTRTLLAYSISTIRPILYSACGLALWSSSHFARIKHRPRGAQAKGLELSAIELPQRMHHCAQPLHIDTVVWKVWSPWGQVVFMEVFSTMVEFTTSSGSGTTGQDLRRRHGGSRIALSI